MRAYNPESECAVVLNRSPGIIIVGVFVVYNFLFGQQNLEFGVGAAAALDGRSRGRVGANGGRCDD